jgi:signal transduction histidine kinase
MELEKSNTSIPIALWKTQIITWGSFASGFMAIFFLIYSSTLSLFKNESTYIFVFLVVMVIGFFTIGFWRSGPFKARALPLFAFLLTAQFLITARVGYVIGPTALGLTLIMLAGMLLGVRWALGIWAISVCIQFATAYLVARDLMPTAFDPAEVDPRNLAVGIRYTLVYATVSIFLAVGISVIVNHLSTSLNQTRNAYEQLSEEHGQRLKAEKEKHDVESQLRSLQRMELLGQLLGGVAHDFNNLLQGIQGYSEIALAKTDKASPVFEDLNEIQRTGERGQNLVKQLLAFSRQQEFELSELHVETTIEEMLSLLRRVIGEQTKIDFVPCRERNRIEADRGQIEQVLMNLCVNARDAMQNGGTIVIGTDRVELSTDFCRRNVWAGPGSFVLLTVSDTGCGMAEESLLRVFEPFYTTKETDKGTGLGLATVFGIVKQHGGFMNVTSELNVGTTFYVYLPHC